MGKSKEKTSLGQNMPSTPFPKSWASFKQKKKR